jgi:hypothetical protein
MHKESYKCSQHRINVTVPNVLFSEIRVIMQNKGIDQLKIMDDVLNSEVVRECDEMMKWTFSVFLKSMRKLLIC